MLKPNLAFSAGSTVALISWLCLSVSLFLPLTLRLAVWNGTIIAVPAVLGVAYAILLVQGLREKTGGGFRSIDAVRTLFSSDSALSAGWLHYLAFDLFVGSWIAQQGLSSGVPRLLIIPCLLLTFLAGPVGFVALLILRFIVAGRLGSPT